MRERFSSRPLAIARRAVAVWVAFGIGAALTAGVARGQEAAAGSDVDRAPAAVDGAGWTGTTHAEDIVAARRAVMLEIERLMRPLDAHAAGEPGDPDRLREAAGTISTFLLTVPHLFPPTTDLHDPSAEIPASLARSEIWKDFAAFHDLAEAASDAAADTLTASADELPMAAARLRAACDACHARFMRTYTPPAVTEEDLEFDFDSLFPAD